MLDIGKSVVPASVGQALNAMFEKSRMPQALSLEGDPAKTG